jgi:urea carboxylase
MSVEVRRGGRMTTVQDLPGRVGLWHVGVPPNGPMDDLSHELVTRIVGNHPHAAALEVTGDGPALHFRESGVIAVGGAPVEVLLDGRPVPMWHPVEVEAGQVLDIGSFEGVGLRGAVALRGGIAVDPYLGSRSTFTLGAFGGLDGRPLGPGDLLPVGDSVAGAPTALPPGLAPELAHAWQLGVVVGPHATAEFLTTEGMTELLGATWTVHHNSARTGVRLIGPKPRWARADGGEAGLHPSNIHDTGYAIGSVDLTGDMPVILGPDGPSLGGFVCPAVVAAAERWKLGQLRPGDRVQLVPWTLDQAEAAWAGRKSFVSRAAHPIEPLARPGWNRPLRPGGTVDQALLGRDEATEDQPAVTYRQAGDRFLLVEFGAMHLDLDLRVRAHALDAWVVENLGPGLVDATAGIRSLLIQVDGEQLDVRAALDVVRAAVGGLADLDGHAFPSRVVHLPLSWDDPATRLAIERYMHGVRADAPWCPWNIEFIRRINGLDSVDDVHRTVFDASYLVLGLGDVYLGAPVATPVDPRHRLVTTKYNPARTWTPENAVGIGGAYMCIYGMEGPGGYQFVGRTVQVWNRAQLGPHFEQPWLLRPFDRIQWHPVEADELLHLRAEQAEGRLVLDIDEGEFRLSDHRRFLAENDADIKEFQHRQQEAFGAERRAWEASGEFDR